MHKLQKDQRYIYVLLSRTHTVPARLIRLFTKAPYSHTSLALDLELKEMYSFARRHIHNPFDSGFVNEDIETGIFGRDKNVYCSVYAIPVTEEQYHIVREELQHFIEHRELYNYNYMGLVGILFGKNISKDYNYFCSQFVSHVLSRSGIELFKKEHGLIQPYDFHLQLRKQRIYSGKLSEYRKYIKANQEREFKDSCVQAV
ncbi:MAG: hypothetical protein K2L07_00995 [Lachnospiraceae bacterium]|nr:hypothetical protein [Lachnospiraceae bacterium]